MNFESLIESVEHVYDAIIEKTYGHKWKYYSDEIDELLELKKSIDKLSAKVDSIVVSKATWNGFDVKKALKGELIEAPEDH